MLLWHTAAHLPLLTLWKEVTMMKPLLYLAMAPSSDVKMSSPNTRSRSTLKIALALVVLSSLALGGCTEKKLDKPLIPPLSGNVPPTPGPAVEPSSTVQAVNSSEPTRDFAASSWPAKSDMSASQQASAMPLPVQANERSVLEIKPSQKSSNR